MRGKVVPCAPEEFRRLTGLPRVAEVCAQIADALEAVRRGELTREEFEEYKAAQKRLLRILTPHATFADGRRKNENAIPSGLCMYDLDHVNDPRGYFEARVEELGIALAHVTPSTEGLRLIFVLPDGMGLPEAQRWMSERLEDQNYDQCVKDYARCSFVVPADLPPLIELLTSRTPDVYKPTVAQAVFPALAAHLWRTRFRYVDNVEHEATLMNVLMAGTGADKNCVNAPIDHIMADIRKRDAENLRREKEWKEEQMTKGANKDRRKRPVGLVIQEIDADMTNPAFVMRMAEADGHFLYAKLNEIDLFDALRGNGKSGQQFQIICLAFDPGNRYGQTRVGIQSVTEKIQIRFNWNATTTIEKGQRYFAKVLSEGPISRINFCTIPAREIGADLPIYGEYDKAFDEELRPYIENLRGATGLVDCPESFALARTLLAENADFARQSQCRVYENLSFRANVIAYLKACVLTVAHGGRWDKAMEDFIRWSLRYDLWCKMRFFGEAIERASEAAGECEGKQGPVNLLEALPRSFNLLDAAQVRSLRHMSEKGTRNMLRVWKSRGYIVELDKDVYQKTGQTEREGV